MIQTYMIQQAEDLGIEWFDRDTEEVKADIMKSTIVVIEDPNKWAFDRGLESS